MKRLPANHCLLVCALLVCCTAAASKDYTYRTMWVSTTGEDSPQCVHDMPASDSDPLPLPQPCRSLYYALRNIRTETINSIFITCGIHVLEPFDTPDATPLLNVTNAMIEGTCADPDGNNQSLIQCTNGANLAFYNAENVEIRYLSFQNCGEQLQHSDSLLVSSTLYFQDCKTVVVQYIFITITAPHGSGISFIKNDPKITPVNTQIGNVFIEHFGIHGTGMHFEVLTAMTRDKIHSTSVKFHLSNTEVFHVNVHPSYNPTMRFTGINITLMGNGEGGEITLSDVNVRRTCIGNGILIALLDRVHGFDVQLADTSIIAIVGLKGSNNMTANPISRDGQFSNISQSGAINSAPYFGIKIAVRGTSTRNHIQVKMSYTDEYRSIPGSAFSIEMTDESEENVVQLKNAGSAFGYERGLQVIITGWAKRNKVQVEDFDSSRHRALWGAGGYIEFSGHAQGNSVNLINAMFTQNHALKGGGIAIICRDFATQNIFKALKLCMFHNSAKLGGGVYAIFQDSSVNNRIHSTNISLYNNTAHCGAGMFICIRDTTAATKVEIINSTYVNNTLLPSPSHTMMGGGVHVELATVRATFKTNNSVNFMRCGFLVNTARNGIGGGISVLYKHSLYEGESGDSVSVDKVRLFHNIAASGSACAFQSLPFQGKRLFRGVTITNVYAYLTSFAFQTMDDAEVLIMFNFNLTLYMSGLTEESQIRMQEELSQTIIPSFQVTTNTNLILAKSVQITAGMLNIFCGASAQGIYALDSEIVLQANTKSKLVQCVATHGGAMALYGESYIRVGKNTTLKLYGNHAFQRGGAIYVSSAPGAVVPVSNCFLQHDQEWEENNSAIIFSSNTAKTEGQSVYASEIRSCFPGNRPSIKNITTDLVITSKAYTVSSSFVRQVNFTFIYNHYSYNIHHNRSQTPLRISRLTSRKYRLIAVQMEIASGPNHVNGPSVNSSKPLTISFIPGKQKRLPYTHAYDEFGSNISSVFTVLINKMDDSVPVELDPFSKYTADFTVILHGIPQQHSRAKEFCNTTNTSVVGKPSQLVLQSVDNKDLLLVMDIELQCCPPGYVFRYGSGDMGTCHCGMTSVTGIAECNETDPEVIGAVLEREYWAGYLASNDRHSCDGQKLFTGSCPPGYCQTQQVTLPENNSQQELQGVVCTGVNRKGLLCGDCLDGKGIAVNFNGIRPVCASCQEGISYVGIPVWFLTEWVPMLAFMFVLMLFNIDLVSGRFNSFLLFAQLLAFSTIRSDAELGPVHNAFVKIYRFLYGMWNLDFFGVLLPPYCLTPHTHLTLLQTLLLHYSIGLFPLTVAITLIVLERSAEKWICCHRVDQCLRRMRRWKAKYSDGMSYDRALPAFVILGFTRFLVSSSYILVSQTITGEDGEGKLVVWWQGSVPYGSIQHIAYFIPAIGILLVFVLLPSFLLLTLPIGPQLFGRLIIAVPALRRLQKIQTFCSNVYTDRWIYHFVNVFQGCYKERFRSFSSLYLFHRIVHLLVAVFIPRAEDALRIQIFLTVALLLLVATCQPYNSSRLNTLDAAILGNLALILILSLHITDFSTPIGTRQFYASLQLILIYLTLLYPCTLLGKKVYLKCRQSRCCQKQEEQREDNAEPLLEAPAERLGNLVLITELRAGLPTSEDADDTVTETDSTIGTVQS